MHFASLNMLVILCCTRRLSSRSIIPRSRTLKLSIANVSLSNDSFISLSRAVSVWKLGEWFTYKDVYIVN